MYGDVEHDPWRYLQYDLRELWLDMADVWPQERRDLYLLRKDVERPLTVDYTAWNEVRNFISHPCLEDHAYPWFDLSELVECAENLAPQLPGPAALIQIERIDPSEPLRIAPPPSLLGYDVADQWALSGLINCGYTPEDRTRFEMDRFIPHLNSHHLFDDPRVAFEFVEVSNKRVEEHQPFYVYMLTLVKTLSPQSNTG